MACIHTNDVFVVLLRALCPKSYMLITVVDSQEESGLISVTGGVQGYRPGCCSGIARGMDPSCGSSSEHAQMWDVFGDCIHSANIKSQALISSPLYMRHLDVQRTSFL